MKTISSALTTFLLDNVVFNRADLISIILPNGQAMNVLFGTNITSITYPTLSASVTVAGTAYPWAIADPTYPFSGTGGSSPTSISMSQGQVITLQYGSGTISDGTDQFDPTGGHGTPTAGSPGFLIQGTSVPSRMCLIGGFVNSSGFLVAPPFYIGNNFVIGPAPAGTAALHLGVNSLTNSGNSGTWTINIVPATYYSSLYGTWERGPFTNKASFKLSSESMKLTALVPETINFPGTTTALMQAINTGVFAGSKVIIQTLFWPLGSAPSSGFSMGTMQLTQGQIGNVKNTGRSKVEFELYDLTQVMNRPFPPHMIQTSCRHTFCDSGCTLIYTNFRTTSLAVTSTSTTLYLDFNIPNRANSTPYLYGNMVLISNVLYMCTTEGTAAGSAPSFNTARGATTTDGGTLVWTSMGSIVNSVSNTNPQQQSFPLGYVIGITGQNTGIKRTIKAQLTSTAPNLELQMLWPLPFAVAAGDTFQLVTGCDKSTLTCQTIYNNLIHIGSEPFVPNPEIAQ